MRSASTVEGCEGFHSRRNVAFFSSRGPLFLEVIHFPGKSAGFLFVRIQLTVQASGFFEVQLLQEPASLAPLLAL